jgi:hypothetical protein
MTLEKAKKLLGSLNIGDAGAQISYEHMMKFNIPDIPDVEHNRRAEWLARQLPPARFEVQGTPNSTYHFRRIA